MEDVKKITGEIKISLDSLSEIQKKVKNIPDYKKEIEGFLDNPVTELLEIVLGGAINLESSDLHIEPEENQAKLRTRIDGILQKVMVFDFKKYQDLLSRIKLLSGIKFNITNQPQDGRFSVLMGEIPIEIRASTLPAEHGESIVLRILNPKNLIEIESLDLREDLLSAFKKEITRPNGMVIVTGPTGCGKTTTLYAILQEIQRPEIKIITIEDPIEYHLKGVSQTQVNPRKGYDFASGLKSIVRQDPDVVLVGEIRDLETAKIALQAALTGHLVFTTLHTNDAAGTVARLNNLGAKPSNIGPAINLIIAQRLVRKVCKKCSKLKTVSPLVLNKLKEELKGIPKKIKIPKLTQQLKIPQVDKGCKDCNFTGYQGRIGIFEAFLVDDKMEKYILTSPSIASLKEEAVKKGMVLMKQDGLIKVLKGTTTIEEVERIVGE
ncbi:GspE/PulE family protein [Patescibacteria group bacterium]